MSVLQYVDEVKKLPRQSFLREERNTKSGFDTASGLNQNKNFSKFTFSILRPISIVVY